jgi:hypothetical protein
MNGSIEGRLQIYDKTPDFRKINGTTDFRSNSPSKRYAPLPKEEKIKIHDDSNQPENEVIIYSDHEDEESMIKMI